MKPQHDPTQPRDDAGRWSEKTHGAPGPSAALTPPSGEEPTSVEEAMGHYGDLMVVDEADFDRDAPFSRVHVRRLDGGTYSRGVEDAFAVAAQRNEPVADGITAALCRAQGDDPTDVETWMEHERAMNAFLKQHGHHIATWSRFAYGAEMTAPARPLAVHTWDAQPVSVYGDRLGPDALTSDVLDAADTDTARAVFEAMDTGEFYDRLVDEVPSLARDQHGIHASWATAMYYDAHPGPSTFRQSEEDAGPPRGYTRAAVPVVAPACESGGRDIVWFKDGGIGAAEAARLQGALPAQVNGMRHNNAPSTGVLLKAAIEHPGKVELGGYLVMPNRADERVLFDTVFVIDDGTMEFESDARDRLRDLGVTVEPRSGDYDDMWRQTLPDGREAWVAWWD